MVCVSPDPSLPDGYEVPFLEGKDLPFEVARVGTGLSLLELVLCESGRAFSPFADDEDSLVDLRVRLVSPGISVDVRRKNLLPSENPGRVTGTGSVTVEAEVLSATNDTWMRCRSYGSNRLVEVIVGLISMTGREMMSLVKERCESLLAAAALYKLCMHNTALCKYG